MVLRPETIEFLQFLRLNPQIRDQIRARPGKTVVYAGKFILPAWREINAFREDHPEYADKQTLPEVLANISLVNHTHNNMLDYLNYVEDNVPWKPDGFIAWRAVSGIFAKNAVGSVSFCVGEGITKEEKVFAATELQVLLRNSNVDDLTKDVLQYYMRCLSNENDALNFSFFSNA